MQRLIWILVFVPITCYEAVAQPQEQILPIVLNGYVREPLHYQTTIRIVNLSTSAVEVTLEAYQNDGTPVRILELFPLPSPGTRTVFRIEPSGSVEAFTAGDVPSLNGWVRLTYEGSAAIQASAEVALISAPVGPHPICHRPSHEVVTTLQVPAVIAAQKFSGFAVVRPHRKGGYALVNPSISSSAIVFLSLLDFSGKLAGSATVQIAPQSRVSRFISEYMPEVPPDFMGSLWITSNVPVGVGSVNVLFPEGKFTTVTVTSAAPAVCAQVVTSARNPLTGECRTFPTPCDVPEGWVRTSSCN